MSDQFSRMLLNKVMGLNRPTLALWPALTGAPAGGATLTPGAGAWGAYADIIAAAAITTEFWLTQIQYDTIGAATELFDLQIYNTTLTTTLYEDRPDTTAATANLGPTTPLFPIYCAPNTQVQGRAGAAAATTINTSLLVATGI